MATPSDTPRTETPSAASRRSAPGDGALADRAAGGLTGRHPVDLRDPVESDRAFRIALAWRELRRGAAAGTLRDYFFGSADDALEQGQMDALDVLLSRRKGWRMSELAEALRVDPSTATRSVQRLVNAGLAERRADDDDGRVVLVVASAEGRRRHSEVWKRQVEAMRELMSAFDSDERGALADLLGRFVDALDEFVAALDLDADTAPRPASRPRSGAVEAAGWGRDVDPVTG